ncbi:GNAT family N-acetyltransferase [Nitratireductor basaltis]|uniref:GNAT family N-acetyltransferase n=1 Tax=Nitratireductor basaltis TaxID=472175 RepID=UPI003CC715C2
MTRLQMEHEPARYPPMPLGQHLALMRVDNIPTHFYRYLYDRVGRDWHWTAALQLSDSELEQRLSSEANDVQVLYLDGAPSGFFELRDEDDSCRLVHFGLMKHAIGRGLSGWFLGCAIRAAWSRSKSRVTVETCTLDHPAALPLYQRAGFMPVERRDESLIPLSEEARRRALYR